MKVCLLIVGRLTVRTCRHQHSDVQTDAITEEETESFRPKAQPGDRNLYVPIAVDLSVDTLPVLGLRVCYNCSCLVSWSLVCVSLLGSTPHSAGCPCSRGNSFFSNNGFIFAPGCTLMYEGSCWGNRASPDWTPMGLDRSKAVRSLGGMVHPDRFSRFPPSSVDRTRRLLGGGWPGNLCNGKHCGHIAWLKRDLYDT